jgi:trigger factor
MELVQGEIPEAMYENQTNEMIREFEGRLRSQGLDMDTYMRYMGMDVNALKGMYRTDAEKRVKLRLALETIAKKENIEVTDADLDEEYGKLAETYKTDVDKVKAAIAADSLTEDIRVQKALDLVKEAAVIK